MGQAFEGQGFDLFQEHPAPVNVTFKIDIDNLTLLVLFEYLVLDHFFRQDIVTEKLND